MAWKLYTDSGCTVPFGGVLSYIHYSDFSDNPQDRVLYYANIDDDPVDNGSYKMITKTGADIVLTITDTTPSSGHEPTELKLATTSAGLATAVAGANLSLGPQIISGLSGARQVHIRVTNAVTEAGLSVELGVRKSETIKVAV